MEMENDEKMSDGVPQNWMDNAAPSLDETWKLEPFPCWPGKVGQAEVLKQGFQPAKKLGVESVSGKGK